MKRLVPLVLLSLVTACGSTVQVSSQQQLGTAADGLGTTTTTAGSAALDPGSPAAQGISSPTSASGAVALPGRAGASGTTSAPTTVPAPGRGPAVPAPTGPVQIGFFVVKDLGPATKALGVDGLSTGNGTTQAKAAVALVNSRGGLFGHKIDPVIYEYDATGDQNTQYQAACGTFFDDHKVRAVVSALLLPTIRACAAEKGVPFLTSGNRTTSAGELAKYPLTALPPQMSLERTVAAWLPSLKAQGWFPAGAKVGLVYNEDPDYAGVPDLVAKGLQQFGLTLQDKQSMPGTDDTSRVSAASSAGQNAALRFKSEGIDHVLALDKSGQALTYFALGAQNGGYYPAYGLTSLSLPALLRTVLSARQLQDARGIGWSPGVDVPVADQPSLSGNQAACLKAMTGAGEDMSSGGTRFSALAICDGALALAAAWARDPQLSPSTFLPGLRAIGRNYAPVLSFATDFSDHVDGNAAFRALSFDAGRDAFVYSGPLTPAR